MRADAIITAMGSEGWSRDATACRDTPVSVYLLPVHSDMILPHVHAASCSLIMICPSGFVGSVAGSAFWI